MIIFGNSYRVTNAVTLLILSEVVLAFRYYQERLKAKNAFRSGTLGNQFLKGKNLFPNNIKISQAEA